MRVIICGGGIAGLSLGVLLGRSGWSVLILEKASGLRGQGYMLDFVGSGYDAAERMELLPTLERALYEISGVTWLNERGRRQSRLDYSDFRKLHNGRFLNLMRGDLEHALFQALPSNVEVRFGTSIQEISTTEPRVDLTLTTGHREQANLLVGADGVHSHVRALLHGQESMFSRYLGFHTGSYVYHDPVAQQELGSEIHLMSVPGRQAGLYPLRDGNVATFFVHRSINPERPESPIDELRRVYGDLGWRVPAILSAADNAGDVFYDQLAQIEIPSWQRGNATLTGDACHAVTLLAGQGASMAVGGAYVLAQALASEPTIEQALWAYEARIAPAVKFKQAAGRAAADFVVPPNRRRLLLREIGVTLAGLPGAERLLRRQLVSRTESVVT